MQGGFGEIIIEQAKNEKMLTAPSKRDTQKMPGQKPGQQCVF